MMDCPDCGIPNVERLTGSHFGHWCPGVPARNERRRYYCEAPALEPEYPDPSFYDEATRMTYEWLEFLASLTTTEER